MMNFLYNLFFSILKIYSIFVVYMRKHFPIFAKIGHEFSYFLGFFEGKWIEPYRWSTCICFFEGDDYNEYYDTGYIFDQKDYYLVLKKHDKWIVSFHEENHNSSLVPVKSPFLFISYKIKDEESILIEIPEEYFVENNELLSNLHIARLLKHHYPNVNFDKDYTLNIMDCELNTFCLNYGSYVILTKDKYTIVNDCD